MIRVHGPQERQQRLVAKDQLPPGLNASQVGEIVLHEHILVHLVDEPLLGIQTEEAVELRVEVLPLRLALIVVSDLHLVKLTQVRHQLQNKIIEVAHDCSVLVVFRELHEAERFDAIDGRLARLSQSRQCGLQGSVKIV